MPLVQMPNGEYVEVADGISDEALGNIKKQFQPTRQQRRAQGLPRKAPLTDEQREVQQRVETTRRIRGNDDLERGIGRGVTANFLDEIGAGVEAATLGTVDAIRHGDVGRIGRRYRVSREASRQLDREAQERSPTLTAIGEIGGAIANPVRTGATAVQGLARAAAGLGATKTATRVGNVATRMNNAGAIPSAIMAGGAQGALNAVGASNELGDVPGALAEGGGVGAVTGGILGGGIHLGARGAQIIKDALPANAQRTAYARIADLLDNAKMTPQQAAREIRVTDLRGGDAKVGDLTPGLRAQEGAISRKPSIPSSNDLIERGADRIAERGGRFVQQVRADANMPAGGDDALARAETLAGTRKAAGQADYAEGGAMDAVQFKPSKEIDDWFRTSPDAERLVRRAYDAAMREGRDPGKIFKEVDTLSGEVRMTAVPTFRAFDYLKRQFDDEIGEALNRGNKQLAAGLSNHLNQLKGMLSDANPEYSKILKTQRDLFQQQEALETGTKVLQRIGREPRQVLADLKKMGDEPQQEARIGIIDALVNLDNKADPVAFFRNVSRNPAQRQVLEFAFGGKKEFRRFQRWIDREVRATRADVLTAPGRQSETARFQMADMDAAHGGVGDVMMNAARGWAFGGAVGGGSAIVRTLNNIATGTSKFAQEEIAKILLSKGDDLVKGVANVKAYRKARETSNRRRAIMGGKAGQQIYTSMAGSD